MKRQWRRTLRAQLRDARVLLRESWMSLCLFAVIVTSGALCFHLFYTYPETGQHPSFSRALHATFTLIFFETTLPFPEQWYLQLLFFLIPILGLVIVAEGLLRFGTALLNKQARGQMLHLSELIVEPGSQLRGWSLKKLAAQLDLSVVCYQGREMTDLHPNPDLVLEAGNKALVLASLETLEKMKGLNQTGEGQSTQAR